jgi:hypothetical protein
MSNTQQKRLQTTIVCFTYKFSDKEVLAMIPDNELMRIKRSDPNPYFRAYVLAHTGEFSPGVVGETGGITATWLKRSIQSMREFVKKGIKFFRGHNEDSSTAGRESLGEIVASHEMEIEGKLSNVVVGYFPPETRKEVKNYNVNSMEAVWSFVKKSGKLIANKMLKLTGIALGNDKYERPAFEGATVLGAVQAFKNTYKEKDDMSDELSFHDIKRYILEKGIFPSQVYDWKSIQSDNNFIPNFREKDDRIAELEKALDDKTKESEKLTTKCSELETGQLKLTAKERYDNLLSEAKDLTDKQKEFLVKQSGKISDFTDDGIKQHFDNSLELYNDVVAPLVKDDTQVKTKEKTGDPGDYTKPENNPFLPAEE